MSEKITSSSAPTSSATLTSQVEQFASRVSCLAPKVDWWNSAIIFMMVVAALAATGLVITQYIAVRRAKELSDAQFKLDKAKDDLLNFDLKRKDEDIEVAKGAASAADTKAESFRVDIARAKEAAATAEARGEAERLARITLEGKITPRRLNGDQAEALSTALKPFGGQRVVISSYAFDTDGIILAQQIERAVLHGSLYVTDEIGAHIPAHAPIVEGVLVTGKNAALVAAVRTALVAAQIGLASELAPQGEELLEFNNEPANVVATIYVGARPLGGSDAAK